MTYKNIKFDDSAVMRSLEKIAIKKGLAIPEAIKKEASLKPVLNLKPSTDLSENIVKLCSGLRSSGFDKYAEEIEIKYLNLKQAETSLYNMMKEKGEDMIEAAHPDGSHMLKNMEGDVVVENLLDQSKKIRDVVNKTPKGKLANVDVINMLKITLAQHQVDSVKNDMKSAYDNLLRAIHVAKDIGNLSNFRLNSLYDYVKDNAAILGKVPTFENILLSIKNVEGFKEEVTSHFFGGVTDNPDAASEIAEYLKKAIDLLNGARSTFTNRSIQHIAPQVKKEPEPQAQIHAINSVEISGSADRGKLSSLALETARRLEGYSSALKINRDYNEKEKLTGLEWIKNQINDIRSNYNLLQSLEDSQFEELKDKISQEVNTLKAETDQFYNEWIK